MSKTKKRYNIMKTVKEQNIIQPKRTKTKKKKVKDVKMVNNINKKGPRLSKLRKIFAPGPPLPLKPSLHKRKVFLNCPAFKHQHRPVVLKVCITTPSCVVLIFQMRTTKIFNCLTHDRWSRKFHSEYKYTNLSKDSDCAVKQKEMSSKK